MIARVWYKSKVLRGEELGRVIGFPTINLSPKTLEKTTKAGVYGCLVRYRNKTYQGLLFYGPRLVKKETHRVLEVHILDFDQDIYDQTIEFKIVFYIRRVRNFNNLEDLAGEIEKDVGRVKKTFGLFDELDRS